MAKSLMKLEALRLRKKGISCKTIAELLGTSKSTVSHWTSEIILSVEQLENLRQLSIKGAELGRLRSALLQKKRRLQVIESARDEARNRLAGLQSREFLIAGIALYWSEGSKKNRRVEFCNSDPRMVKFFIRWLQSCFSVKSEELRGYIGINEIHLKREEIVKQYWSELTGIPLNQFRKTYFKKAANKKVYKNFNEHYGTLNIRVVKSASLYYKVMGLIDGLCMAA